MTKRRRYVSSRDAEDAYDSRARALVGVGAITEGDAQRIKQEALRAGAGRQGALDVLIPLGNDWMSSKNQRPRPDPMRLYDELRRLKWGK